MCITIIVCHLLRYIKKKKKKKGGKKIKAWMLLNQMHTEKQMCAAALRHRIFFFFFFFLDLALEVKFRCNNNLDICTVSLIWCIFDVVVEQMLRNFEFSYK